VGRHLDGGGGGAPLISTGYQKRGRLRWPIKAGEWERVRSLGSRAWY
jgi:hypothetical protein